VNQLPAAASVRGGPSIVAGGRVRDRAVFMTGLAVLAVAVVVVTTPVADRDSGAGLWSSLRDASADLHWQGWRFLPVVAALAGLHYLLAATALRAAAGARLGMWEATLAQLAAAAANRVTPAGLGAAVVNVRYLSRRGLSRAPAVGAVAALGALGAVADVLLVLFVLLVGTWAGIPGGAHELSALGSGMWRFVDGFGRLPRPAQAGLALAVVALVGCLRPLLRAGGRSHASAAATSVADAFRHAAALGRRPHDLVVLMACSAATTLVLGVAFTVCTVGVTGTVGSLGGLLMAYLVGAGAAAALPVPAGLGSTEAVLVAALVAARIRPGDAVQAVLIFRVVTFWAPVPLGVLAARTLRRRRAL